MNFKSLSIVGLAAFSLLLGAGASAGDPDTQSAAEAAAEAMPAPEADAMATTEATTEAATEAMASEMSDAEAKMEAKTETKAEGKEKESFEEKVTAYNKDKKDDNKVICRREKKTGSHFSRRRCVTAAQAEREREDAQDALQRASRGTNTGPTN